MFKIRKEINLYLDDRRDCPEGFVLAKNIEEAIHYVENYDINILSLDHDLGMDKETKEVLKTGYDFVKIFCENGYFAKKIYLHTDNIVGRDAMYSVLKASQRRGFISKDIEIFNYECVKGKYTGDDFEGFE